MGVPHAWHAADRRRGAEAPFLGPPGFWEPGRLRAEARPEGAQKTPVQARLPGQARTRAVLRDIRRMATGRTGVHELSRRQRCGAWLEKKKKKKKKKKKNEFSFLSHPF